jgi:hypothetical protein
MEKHHSRFEQYQLVKPTYTYVLVAVLFVNPGPPMTSFHAALLLLLETLRVSLQEAKCHENKAVTALLEKRGGLVHPNPKLDALVSVRSTNAFITSLNLRCNG